MSNSETPQTPTHVVVEISIVQAISRILTRSIMDGQEAAELFKALQSARPMTLKQERT